MPHQVELNHIRHRKCEGHSRGIHILMMVCTFRRCIADDCVKVAANPSHRGVLLAALPCVLEIAKRYHHYDLTKTSDKLYIYIQVYMYIAVPFSLHHNAGSLESASFTALAEPLLLPLFDITDRALRAQLLQHLQVSSQLQFKYNFDVLRCATHQKEFMIMVTVPCPQVCGLHAQWAGFREHTSGLQ